MQKTAQIAQILVRVTGVIQIVLGLLFWLGTAYFLVPVHILSGLIFVTAIWVLAALYLRAGLDARFGVAVILYGLLVVALGMRQGILLPGPLHWIIRVVHLAVGLGAMALAQRLSSGLSAIKTSARLVS